MKVVQARTRQGALKMGEKETEEQFNQRTEMFNNIDTQDAIMANETDFAILMPRTDQKQKGFLQMMKENDEQY